MSAHPPGHQRSRGHEPRSHHPQEHHLPVTRTARYYTLGAPSEDVREVWIVCHGYGQLARRFLHHFAALDDGRRWIVAPEALSRFYLDDLRRAGAPSAAERRVGATWMTREDRLSEIGDHVAYLDALTAQLRAQLPDATVPLHTLGFSQGVATVTRWLAAGTAEVDRLVLWAGMAPPELDAAEGAALPPRLRVRRVTLVAGARDDMIDSAAVLGQADRLRALGVEVDTLSFDGGHHIDADALARLTAG
jgi:predicted esterase